MFACPLQHVAPVTWFDWQKRSAAKTGYSSQIAETKAPFQSMHYSLIVIEFAGRSLPMSFGRDVTVVASEAPNVTLIVINVFKYFVLIDVWNLSILKQTLLTLQNQWQLKSGPCIVRHLIGHANYSVETFADQATSSSCIIKGYRKLDLKYFEWLVYFVKLSTL